MNFKSYKNTEIGMLPVEWDVKPFDETFRILNNNTFSRDELNYVGGTCKDVHYGDVLILFDNFVDISDKKVPFINNDKVVNSVRLKDGDIIIADTAEDETVGKAVEVINSGKIDATSGLHTMLCRKRNDDFSKYYLGYYINSKLFHNQLLQYITGTKVSSVSKTDIKKTYVVIPHKDEQERIVQCLMSIDSQIQTLEKIIEKKKHIKSVAIKQIFQNGLEQKNKWIKRKLDRNICDITTGHKDVNEGSPTGIYPFFTCSRNEYKSNSYSFDMEAIMVAGNGEVGNLHYYNGKFETYQRTYVLYNFKVNIKYIYYYLDYYLMKILKEKALGTTISYIVLNQLTDFEVNMPNNSKEIERIVAIIDSFENELILLDSKLQKLKNIKSTILEDLITGKRRLTK